MEFLYLLLDNFPDPVFGVGRDQKIILWNRAIEALTGLPRDEMLGRGDYAYALPFYGRRRPCLVDLLLGNEPDRTSLDYSLWKQNGCIRAEKYSPALNMWLDAATYPVLDHDGRLLCALELVRDVTALKEAERKLCHQQNYLDELVRKQTELTERCKAKKEALRASREQFRVAFEYAGIGMALMDTNGTCLQANNALCKLLGATGEELRGTTFRAVTHADDIARVAKHIDELLSGSAHACAYEKRYLTKRGKTIWVSAHLALVKDAEGNPSCFILQAQDITAQKEAAAQLQRHQKQLEALAFELSLAEAREQRRLAAELHDNIGQILSLIHMRLTTLKQYVRPEGRHQLTQILQLLQQCLSYARTLTFELSPPVLYDDGLEAAVQRLGKRFETGYGINFQYQSDGQPKPLHMEKLVLLFQMVRELMVNVVKHARADRVRVSIRRKRDHIEICVEDNGLGGADPYNGTTGFGLFNIRERLEHIGGGLNCTSRPGRGTRICLSVPLDT